MQDKLTAGTRIRCALDARERPLHCHHEKTIVIDDRVAFVGGIDLTTEAGDRFDTSRHPSRAAVGWHDASVRLEGPAVIDVAEHFRMRWNEVTRETLPEPAQAPVAERGIPVHVVRTVPEGIYRAVPRGDFRILESYVRAFRDAERLSRMRSVPPRGSGGSDIDSLQDGLTHPLPRGGTEFMPHDESEKGSG